MGIPFALFVSIPMDNGLSLWELRRPLHPNSDRTMTEQHTKSQELIERRKAAVPHGVGTFNYATAVDAKGAFITDADGNELIDFAGGIGVVNAGHCPPPVVKAIQEQAAKYPARELQRGQLRAVRRPVREAERACCRMAARRRPCW
jgi:4-aminobutyrate aminotransferase-like enzyme